MFASQNIISDENKTYPPSQKFNCISIFVIRYSRRLCRQYLVFLQPFNRNQRKWPGGWIKSLTGAQSLPQHLFNRYLHATTQRSNSRAAPRVSLCPCRKCIGQAAVVLLQQFYLPARRHAEPSHH